MHNLKPVTALGSETPRIDVIGTIRIAENDQISLASVAARLGQEATCVKSCEGFLGAAPAVGKAIFREPEFGFWTVPDQWMIGAPIASHENLASQLKDSFGSAASITEQTGAWVVFDANGEKIADLCEILCNVPIRKMQMGDVQRTMLHQLGCFVIKQNETDHLRVMGPRAAAGSLHHALTTAAQAIS